VGGSIYRQDLSHQSVPQTGAKGSLRTDAKALRAPFSLLTTRTGAKAPLYFGFISQPVLKPLAAPNESPLLYQCCFSHPYISSPNFLLIFVSYHVQLDEACCRTRIDAYIGGPLLFLSV
jgi:hypothetical protein